MSLLSAIGNELAGLFDLLFPAACPLCRRELTSVSPSGLCPACFEQFTPLPAPRCPRCALPYVTDGGNDHLCETCLREAPAFERVVALGAYEGLLREAVHRFKFENVLSLDRVFGTLLAERIEQELPTTRFELILPVPLHVRRLRQRGYNQSLLLARRLGKRWRLPVASRQLVRTHPTPPQQGLSLSVRQRNPRGAFALTTPLHGESVLLIDDVMTTGATVRECAQTLWRGGAGQVMVAVIGRALRHR